MSDKINFNIYQARSGGICLSYGVSFAYLTKKQIEDLRIDVYSLRDFDIDSFNEFYKNKFTLTFKNTNHETKIEEQINKVIEEYGEFYDEMLSSNLSSSASLKSELKDLISASLKLLTEHLLEENEMLQEFWDKEDVKNEERDYYE